jgi:hypothetical protein
MPPLKFENTGKRLEVFLQHDDGVIGCPLLREALGSTSDEFVNAPILQLENARSRQDPDLNFALSVIKKHKAE